MKPPITLAKLQGHVRKRDPKPKRQKYFLKLIEEIGELSEMIKDDQRLDPDDERTKAIKGTMEEEIADVLYYVAAIANAYEIDLEQAFIRKAKYTRKKENGK